MLLVCRYSFIFSLHCWPLGSCCIFICRMVFVFHFNGFLAARHIFLFWQNFDNNYYTMLDFVYIAVGPIAYSQPLSNFSLDLIEMNYFCLILVTVVLSVECKPARIAREWKMSSSASIRTIEIIVGCYLSNLDWLHHSGYSGCMKTYSLYFKPFSQSDIEFWNFINVLNVWKI